MMVLFSKDGGLDELRLSDGADTASDWAAGPNKPMYDFVQRDNGNVLGAIPGLNLIYAFEKRNNCILAGSRSGDGLGDLTTEAQFRNPLSIVRDGTNDAQFIVADFNNKKLKYVNLTKKRVSSYSEDLEERPTALLWFKEKLYISAHPTFYLHDPNAETGQQLKRLNTPNSNKNYGPFDQVKFKRHYDLDILDNARDMIIATTGVSDADTRCLELLHLKTGAMRALPVCIEENCTTSTNFLNYPYSTLKTKEGLLVAIESKVFKLTGELLNYVK